MSLCCLPAVAVAVIVVAIGRMYKFDNTEPRLLPWLRLHLTDAYLNEYLYMDLFDISSMIKPYLYCESFMHANMFTVTGGRSCSVSSYATE